MFFPVSVNNSTCIEDVGSISWKQLRSSRGTLAMMMVLLVVNIWNSLPNTVVVNTCTFKAWLDKFWSHQVVKFDFTADLTGTGNRSGVVISRLCF